MTNPKELEKVTEENPELVQSALPNTPIAEEAKQITEDKDKRNDEVSNKAVEDTLSGPGASFIDWDKVKVYKPGEDPYLSVHEGYDPRIEANNEYEYPEATEDHTEEVKDEDFLGPDEYIDENGNIQVDPNWKPENADEDFAGPDELPAVMNQSRDEYSVDPDKQLAISNGRVPEEIHLEPAYDTSDYNFDWNAVVETLPPDLQEDMESLPEEDKEEISRLLHINLGKVISNEISAPTSSFSESNPAIDIKEAPHTSSSAKRPGTSMLGMSLGATSVSVHGNVNRPEQIDSVNSIASAGPIPPKEANATEGKAIAGSNNSIPRSNGSIGSGAGLLFHKVGLLKPESSAPDVPMTGHASDIPDTEVDDIKDGLVATLEAKLNANPDEAMSKGFEHSGKHWSYNDISLDEMTVKDLNELVKLIE